MFQVGALVAAVEEIPILWRDGSSLHTAEAHASVGHLASLLPDLLALVLRQRGQEVVEAGIGRSCVFPVKLHGLAQHHAGFAAGLQIVFAGKQQVQGRQLLGLAPFNECFEQGSSVPCAARQQACAWHRCEGYSHQRLGVIVQAVLRIGFGPGPVKHVLAVGMDLDVERARRQQDPIARQCDEVRCPACFGNGSAAAVQCAQVFVAHEGCGLCLQTQQFVPVCRIHGIGRVLYLNDIIVGLVLHWLFLSFTPAVHDTQNLRCPT